MSFFRAMEVSASGLDAQRVRMNVASSNLANASTTRSAAGGPYRRQSVVVASTPSPAGSADPFDSAVRGVQVANIVADPDPPRLEYDPGHPDANAEGFVAYPNINLVEEMVDMITASRAYEAGITALRSAVNMSERALGIGR